MAGKICRILSALFVISLLLFSLAFSIPPLLGVKTFAVISGSMEPAIAAGSLVYVREVPPETIEAGDIITFTLAGGIPATHRVMEIRKEGRIFITKGDANELRDTPVSFDRLVGRVELSIPFLGYLAATARSIAGIPMMIGSIATVALLALLPSAFEREGSGEENAKSGG